MNCCRQKVLNKFIFNPVIFVFFFHFHRRIRAFLIKDSPLPRYLFHGTVLNQKCCSISKSDAKNNNSSSNQFVFSFVDILRWMLKFLPSNFIQTQAEQYYQLISIKFDRGKTMVKECRNWVERIYGTPFMDEPTFISCFDKEKFVQIHEFRTFAISFRYGIRRKTMSLNESFIRSEFDCHIAITLLIVLW